MKMKMTCGLEMGDLGRQSGEGELSNQSGCWSVLVDKMLGTSPTCFSYRDEAGWSGSQVQLGVRGNGDLGTGMLSLMENGVTLNSGRGREAGYKEKNG